MIHHTSYKVLHFLYYFTHRNVTSQFKNNLCEKGKVDTRTPDSRQGGGGGGIHLKKKKVEFRSIHARVREKGLMTGFIFLAGRRAYKWGGGGGGGEWVIFRSLRYCNLSDRLS